MCIIAISPKSTNIPSADKRKAMFASNPDGAGFMYPFRGRVRIEKGFMSFQAMEDRLAELGKSIDLYETPIVFHYRIGTHGGNTPQNTHPFPVTSNRHSLRELNIDTWLGCAHNGIIRTVKPRRGYSDTQEYIVRKLSHLRHNFTHDDKKLARILKETGSKLAFLSPTGEITTVGEFVDGFDGCKYSNWSFEPYKYAKNWTKWSWYDDGYTLWDAASYKSTDESADTYKADIVTLDEEVIIEDGDGFLHEGNEYCADQYGRLYSYNADGTATLDSRARIIYSGSRSAQSPTSAYSSWYYDEIDDDDWDDLTYIPALEKGGE